MTREEARDVMENIWDFTDAQDEEKGDIVDDAIIEVLECIEKQIPKKVVKVKIPNTSFCKASTRYKCPSCSVTLCSDWKFCFECGQALDWSEERE